MCAIPKDVSAHVPLMGGFLSGELAKTIFVIIPQAASKLCGKAQMFSKPSLAYGFAVPFVVSLCLLVAILDLRNCATCLLAPLSDFNSATISHVILTAAMVGLG